MAWDTDDNGELVEYNYETNRWEYPDERDVIDVHGKKRKVCSKCNKPQIDSNGVINCDFCLQGLTICDFIDAACCGHGDKEKAYIALADGRRFILDVEWSE